MCASVFSPYTLCNCQTQHRGKKAASSASVRLDNFKCAQFILMVMDCD